LAKECPSRKQDDLRRGRLIKRPSPKNVDLASIFRGVLIHKRARRDSACRHSSLRVAGLLISNIEMTRLATIAPSFIILKCCSSITLISPVTVQKMFADLHRFSHRHHLETILTASSAFIRVNFSDDDLRTHTRAREARHVAPSRSLLLQNSCQPAKRWSRG